MILFKIGLRDWIWTSDLLHPKQVLYQAEPRADVEIEDVYY